MSVESFIEQALQIRTGRRGFFAVGATAITVSLGLTPVGAPNNSYDWILLNHGRGGNGNQMLGIKAKLEKLSGLVAGPDQIITHNYPDSANPNLASWMPKTYQEMEKAIEKYGPRGWIWAYSASVPVVFSTIGEYALLLPKEVRGNLRLRLLGGGMRGNVADIYDLINADGYENKVEPFVDGRIDHLHAYGDGTILETSAKDLAVKFGYEDNLRFVRGTDHGSILERDELITLNMLKRQDSDL